MNLKEKVKKIKEELKKLGYTNRKISVRSSSCSIKCIIKDLTININDIKEITKKYENIYRDPNGEILSGGNTFINVSYDFYIYESAKKEKIKEAREILDKIHENKNIKDDGIYILVYYPSLKQINLLKRPKDYKKQKSYCLKTIINFKTFNESDIAKALLEYELFMNNLKEEE